MYPVWPCLAPFGPVWPRLTPFGSKWPRLPLFGSVLLCLAPFGNVWSRLALLVPVWPCLALFDPVWPRLVPVNICPSLAPFGTVFPIWLRLAWFGLFDPIYTLVTKLTLGDNCHRWKPTFHRMVPQPPKDGHHQPKDGHPPEGSVQKTGNLALRLNIQN